MDRSLRESDEHAAEKVVLAQSSRALEALLEHRLPVGVPLVELDGRDQPPVVPRDPILAELEGEIDPPRRPLDGALEVLGVHPERCDFAVRASEISPRRKLFEQHDRGLRRL